MVSEKANPGHISLSNGILRRIFSDKLMLNSPRFDPVSMQSGSFFGPSETPE